MLPQTPANGDESDSFRLHYVRKGRRCVVSFDTLEAAIAGAFKRLEKDPEVEVWISDDAKRVLLDGSGLRSQFVQRNASGGSGS